MRRNPPQKRSIIPGCLVAVVVLFALGVYGVVKYNELVQPLSPGSRSRILVEIPRGDSARRIGTLLAERKVLRSKEALVFAIRMSGHTKPLKPGVYELSPAMSPAQVLDVLENGRVSMNAITFPEGWTLEQMGSALQKRGMCDRGQFLEIAKHEGRTFTAPQGFVAPSDNLEGYLFPDTYRFVQHSDPRMIISEMLGNFEHRVVLSHPRVHSWHDVMIVASLVEREARVPEDRPLIAGVIDNRLRIGMRLQIDASVQYALPEHKARLMFSDLKVSSPYNTYRHGGLPPTPICCPGIPCIEAAINPTPSQYLFYVAGPGDKHIFTKSIAEHEAVIHKLRDPALH